MRLTLLARLAWASGWGGGRRERGRAALVAVATSLVTVVACGTVSAWMMSQRINERVEARNFAPAEAEQTAAFERHVMYDQLPSGDGVLVAWWRRLPGAPPIPGVAPEATTGWFVSPALAARAAADPTIASRYPNANQIEPAGVGRADELVAYRLVDDAAIELPERMTATPFEYLGENAELELLPVVLAALALIGIPGVGLLSGALSVATRDRHRRTSLLSVLGAPAATTTSLRGLEAAFAAVPGAVVAAVAWALLSGELTAVPVIGRPCLAGDLALPAPWAISVTAFVVLVAAAVAMVSRSARGSTRPSAVAPTAPAARRLIVAVAGIVIVALSATIAKGSTQPKLFLAGIVVTLIGLPLALPNVIYRLGNYVSSAAQGSRAVLLLTGRSMALRAVTSARSLGVLLAVAALAPVAASWVGVARDIEPRRETATLYRATGLSADEAQEFASTHGLAMLTINAEPDDDTGRFVAVGDCELLADALPDLTCTAAGELVGRLGGLPPIELQPAPPPGFTPGATSFVITPGSPAENALRTLAVNADRPGINVSGGDRQRESPLVDWILGASRIAVGMASLALAIHLAAQAHRTAVSRSRLGATGASHGFIRRISAQEAGLTVLAAGAVGLAAGVAIAVNFVILEPAARLPWAALALAALAIAALVALASTTAWIASPDPTELWSERNHTGW